VNIAGDLLPPKSAGESCSKFIKRRDGGEMEMAGKVVGKRGKVQQPHSSLLLTFSAGSSPFRPRKSPYQPQS